jgi:hypothetical protein
MLDSQKDALKRSWRQKRLKDKGVRYARTSDRELFYVDVEKLKMTRAFNAVKNVLGNFKLKKGDWRIELSSEQENLCALAAGPEYQVNIRHFAGIKRRTYFPRAYYQWMYNNAFQVSHVALFKPNEISMTKGDFEMTFIF